MLPREVLGQDRWDIIIPRVTEKRFGGGHVMITVTADGWHDFGLVYARLTLLYVRLMREESECKDQSQGPQPRSDS
jgi:hypothetical protein